MDVLADPNWRNCALPTQTRRNQSELRYDWAASGRLLPGRSYMPIQEPTVNQRFSSTRRSFSRGLAVSAALATLPIARISAAQSTPASDATPVGATRTITDILGKQVVVPANPQRVVVLDINLLGLALALGVKPIAASKYATAEAFPQVLAGQTAGIEPLAKNEELDIEHVLNLRPDLILMTYYGDDTTYDLVKEIAPTVLAGEFRTDWRSDSAIVGEALNRSTELAALSDAYDNRIAQVAADLPDEFKGSQTAVLRFRAEDIRLLNDSASASAVLADVSLLSPPTADGDTGVSTDLSLERIRDVDFPSLWVVSDGGDDADKGLADAVASPLVQSLAAVKDGHFYFVDQEWWITLRGYLAANLILDDVQAHLIDGKPSTNLPS
jgi:iron complex transport system substrate-binding protein